MPALASIAADRLAVLDAANLRRAPARADERPAALRIRRGGRELLSFACNDYLGLTHHPDVVAAGRLALEQAGSGAAASRLITGSQTAHARLEASLAAWKGYPSASLFGSGYLANLGAVTALMERGDLILLDRLSHACLLDAAQLSGARWMRFRHNDMADLRRLLGRHRAGYRHCLIVTETVFSMDGDRAPLRDIADMAADHGAWWLADDAHGLGEALEARPDILTGTLSKALASYGGYALAETEVIAYLQTRARSFVYSTALPPSAVAAAEGALGILQARPAMADIPLAHALHFCRRLVLPAPSSQIVPMILGDATRAMDAASVLEQAGFLVAAIRPPTVPAGTARLRFSFSAGHEPSEVDALCAAVERLQHRAQAA